MNNQSGSAGTESTQDYFIIVGQLKIQPSRNQSNTISIYFYSLYKKSLDENMAMHGLKCKYTEKMSSDDKQV